MLLSQLFTAFPFILGHIALGGSAETHDPSTFSTWLEESSFPGCIPPNDTINSVVAVKPGYSGLVIGYQIDEYTHTCLALLHFSIIYLP